MRKSPQRGIFPLVAVVGLLFLPTAVWSQQRPGAEGNDPPSPAEPPPALVDVRSTPLPSPLPRRSLSTSKQFVVFAESGAMRSAIGIIGEEVRDGVRRLLGPEATEKWKIPIVVDLRRPLPGLPGTPIPSRLTLGQTGLGLKIQLEILLGDAGRPISPRTELARALLLEIAYREASDLPAGRPFRRPPAWLVEGVAAYLETCADETGASADRMGEVLGAKQVTLPFADFLTEDPTGLDTPSRQVYRAYAYGMVRLITEEVPGGREALLGLLRALPGDLTTAEPGPAPLLARLLSSDPPALERWWLAGRARLAEVQSATSLMTVEETEHRLAAVLFVTLPGETAPSPKRTPAAAASPPASPAAGRVVSLEDFARQADPGTAVRRAVLTPVRAGVVGLFSRAHPFYQPIIAGYDATIQVLAQGGADARRTPERLHRLAFERASACTRSEAITDYLNWFEATQPTDSSHDFDAYFEAARQIAADANVPGHHRSDPISLYLDAIEAEY